MLAPRSDNLVRHILKTKNVHVQSLVIKCVNEMQFRQLFCCKILLDDVKTILVVFTDNKSYNGFPGSYPKCILKGQELVII